MNTHAAFTELTSQRSWNRLSGITSEQARTIKYAYKKGKVSQDKVFELLINAGYKHTPIKWIKKGNYIFIQPK